MYIFSRGSFSKDFFFFFGGGKQNNFKILSINVYSALFEIGLLQEVFKFLKNIYSKAIQNGGKSNCVLVKKCDAYGEACKKMWCEKHVKKMWCVRRSM